jgi:Flp pilus assembly protein TadD
MDPFSIDQATRSYAFACAYGAVLYRAKEYEAAVKQLEAAAALRKRPSPSVWLLLAMAQNRCERKDQATQWPSKRATGSRRRATPNLEVRATTN